MNRIPIPAAVERPTYQDLLDDALEQTFPASDPIAFSAATYTASSIVSARNSVDWSLEPRPSPSKRPVR
jgi:hypothetical protein